MADLLSPQKISRDNRGCFASCANARRRAHRSIGMLATRRLSLAALQLQHECRWSRSPSWFWETMMEVDRMSAVWEWCPLFASEILRGGWLWETRELVRPLPIQQRVWLKKLDVQMSRVISQCLFQATSLWLELTLLKAQRLLGTTLARCWSVKIPEDIQFFIFSWAGGPSSPIPPPHPPLAGRPRNLPPLIA